MALRSLYTSHTVTSSYKMLWVPPTNTRRQKHCAEDWGPHHMWG